MYDVAIVGGGIVGLATGYALLQERPGLRLAILDKETELASHQTGHNSGVIHSGIYYKPGSLKAQLCREGVSRLMAFCEAHGIPYQLVGKVIVATEEREIPALEELLRRGTANGVPSLRRIGPEELREIEPGARAVAALHSPSTGIVDYPAVARAIAAEIRAAGGEVLTGAAVKQIHRDGAGVRLVTARGDVSARLVVNCAGLYSDEIARMAGADPGVQIVPFRGEYYLLAPERHSLVRGLIYPVPNPEFPFLGVHLTRTVHGVVEAGPNAVLAFAREGYTRGRIRGMELGQTLAYPGFRAVARRFWRTGLYEIYRSFSKREFVRSLQRLLPDLQGSDLVPGGAGVRAQAVTREGKLVDDFHIVETDSAIHVLNAPSPAATASLAIGRRISALALKRFA
jgi:L-2-hydroxyglutarate oxidase LhgO